jgi:hypothetical protein
MDWYDVGFIDSLALDFGVLLTCERDIRDPVREYRE